MSLINCEICRDVNWSEKVRYSGYCGSKSRRNIPNNW